MHSELLLGMSGHIAKDKDEEGERGERKVYAHKKKIKKQLVLLTM